MPNEVKQIDAPRLYRDLQNHFGTASESIPWICSTHWLSMALAELETAARADDWDTVIKMAQDEGFDLERYVI